MTDCRVARRLQPYLDGALGDRARLALEAHVARCAACRQALIQLRRLDAGLREEPALLPPEGLAAAIACRAAARQHAAHRLPGRLEALTVGGLAVAAAATVVSAYLPHAGQVFAGPESSLPLAAGVALAALGWGYLGHAPGG